MARIKRKLEQNEFEEGTARFYYKSYELNPAGITNEKVLTTILKQTLLKIYLPYVEGTIGINASSEKTDAIKHIEENYGLKNNGDLEFAFKQIKDYQPTSEQLLKLSCSIQRGVIDIRRGQMKRTLAIGAASSVLTLGALASGVLGFIFRKNWGTDVLSFAAIASAIAPAGVLCYSTKFLIKEDLPALRNFRNGINR